MKYTQSIIVLLIAAFSINAVSDEKGAAKGINNTARTASNKTAMVLDSSNSGAWQFAPLPKQWLQANWPAVDGKNVYLALRGPDPDDMAEYAPCSDPVRMLVGIKDKDGRASEKLLTCIDYCQIEQESVKGSNSLWGRASYLEGFTAQILENNQIDVMLYYRKKLPVSSQLKLNPMVVNKTKLGPETRIRHVNYTPSDLKAAADRHGKNSCVNFVSNTK